MKVNSIRSILLSCMCGWAVSACEPAASNSETSSTSEATASLEAPASKVTDGEATSEEDNDPQILKWEPKFSSGEVLGLELKLQAEDSYLDTADYVFSVVTGACGTFTSTTFYEWEEGDSCELASQPNCRNNSAGQSVYRVPTNENCFEPGGTVSVSLKKVGGLIVMLEDISSDDGLVDDFSNFDYKLSFGDTTAVIKGKDIGEGLNPAIQ